MKTKLIFRTMGLLILMATFFVLSSCSKSDDKNLTTDKKELDKNLEAAAIDEKDYTESDEDFTTVDYKEFYEELAPHGEWVQVKPEELGLKPTSSSGVSDKKDITLSKLLGIKDANANTLTGPELIFVWKPSTDLAVVQVAAETPVETPVYVPYTNGQWINTDAGWYFKAPTPVEETVSHYGRWVNTVNDGWLWVPGRVWSPAWVDWKQNDDYIAWAPLPPSVYVVNDNIVVPQIDEDRYVVVEKKYFVQPQLYKYMYKENKNKIMIKEMTRTNGVMIMNKTIINKGPEVSDIEKYWGNTIQMVKIHKVKGKNEQKYSDREYYVYTPVFSKVKYKENMRTPIYQPKTYVKYDDWKVRKSAGKEYKKEEKEYKKEEKEYKKEEKEYKKDNKEYKKDDNTKDNGKKNDGNDNSKKNDGKDNGKKNNGKDNGKGKK